MLNNKKHLLRSLNLPLIIYLMKKQLIYLAKGELYGSSKPLWRTQRHQLKGTGFNYDFADGEGPARDLQTGKHALQDPLEVANSRS